MALRDICSMCGGENKPQPNYQKMVDPPIPPYGTLLGDEPPSDGLGKRCRGGMAPGMQIRLPMSGMTHGTESFSQGKCQPSTIIQVPQDPHRSQPKFICNPCPPPPPTKLWLIKSSPVPQKSACLPIGGAPDQECSQQPRIMICLPCPPPVPVEPKKEEKKKKGPIGLVTHCKELDLVGSKFITTCLCGMRNGLSGESCQRISCQNNPGCFMNPPQCWPRYEEEKEPPPPPKLPKQELICIPIEFSYYDNNNNNNDNSNMNNHQSGQ